MSLTKQAQRAEVIADAAKSYRPSADPTRGEVTLTHDEFVTMVTREVERHPHARNLRGTEQQALSQEVAVSLLPTVTGAARGSAREVLRYIDRCERMPLTMAERDRHLRSHVTRSLVRARIDRTMHESRAWRDTCDGYRVRDRAARETERAEVAQVVAADFAEPLGEDEAPSVTYSAMVAESVRRAEIRAPLSLDADQLAADLAGALARTETDRRRVRAAILRVTAERPADALALLATAEGRSLKSIRNDATDGLKMLSAMTRRDLREALESVTEPEPETEPSRREGPGLDPLPRRWGRVRTLAPYWRGAAARLAALGVPRHRPTVRDLLAYIESRLDRPMLRTLSTEPPSTVGATRWEGSSRYGTGYAGACSVAYLYREGSRR